MTDRRRKRIAVRRPLRRNPDTAAPPVRAGRRQIVRVLDVVDTRQYEEIEEGVFKPIPGSGSPHLCSRCGRTHEVHALVELDDGETELVGTGCASKASMDVAAQVKTEMARQKNLDKWTRVLASLERKDAAWEAVVRAVDALPFPAAERVGPTPVRGGTGMLWRCGDVTITDTFWGDRQSRFSEAEADLRRSQWSSAMDDWRRHEEYNDKGFRETVRAKWREERLRERWGPTPFPYGLSDEIRSARRKVKALRASGKP